MHVQGPSCHFRGCRLGFVGKLARRPESEQFFRLAKLVPSASVGNSKQAMLVLSSIQPVAARRTTAAALIRPLLRQQQIKRFKKKGRLKPDRVFSTEPNIHLPSGR